MNSIKIIIETPKGSAQKYTYDSVEKTFELKKILPLGMVFPYDFGLIPGTLGEDGDPLDILVISELQSFPGCVMNCRVIGGFTANQTERNGEQMRNDRFYAIPELSTIFKNISTSSDLPASKLQEIEKFFIQYNELAGKKFSILQRINARAAMKLIDSKRAAKP